MKNLAREAALQAVRSSAWKKTSRWIRGTDRWNQLELEYDGSYVNAEVVVYFGDRKPKFYQLSQWIPVLEQLNRIHRVVLVFRKPSALLAAREITDLPMVLKRRFDPLQTFYHANSFRLALYVNNGMTNFQSLSFAPMVHVHVNHGESDKLSMVSNQAKSYDKVFVAGDAAIDRHRKALVDFDESSLVKVGRPQLDIERQPELNVAQGQTVMYAPTWEGENAANNYTSVDMFGPQIVAAAIALPGTRVIYKPHPRVCTSSDPSMVSAHQQIVDLINEANELIDDADQHHQVFLDGDILAMFDAVDLLVTDISSVGLDFLYLRPDKPLILTDRRDDSQTLNLEAPVSRVTPIIDTSTVRSIGEMLQRTLAQDPWSAARQDMRRYYFGDGDMGQSTVSFTNAVSSLISERSRSLQDRSLADESNAEASDE